MMILRVKIENFRNKGKRIRNKTREYFDDDDNEEEIQETPTNDSESTFCCGLKAPNSKKQIKPSNSINSEINKSTDLISSEDIENNHLK